MFVVDTNIFLYAAVEDFEEHGRCEALLEDWRRARLPWFTTWSILYEFLRVTTHPKVLTSPLSAGEAWEFVESLLSAPSLEVLVQTERHAAVAAQTIADLPDVRGNLLHDLHIAILMREHGVRQIYTRDGDFRRFPFLSVVDPLEG